MVDREWLAVMVTVCVCVCVTLRVSTRHGEHKAHCTCCFDQMNKISINERACALFIQQGALHVNVGKHTHPRALILWYQTGYIQLGVSVGHLSQKTTLALICFYFFPYCFDLGLYICSFPYAQRSKHRSAKKPLASFVTSFHLEHHS